MSKRLWVLPVLVAMLIATGSGIGLAIPSLYGPTGIVTVPNAMVAPMGQVQVAGSYQRFQGTLDQAVIANTLDALGLYVPGGDDDFSSWSLQALTGIADGAELWAAYLKDNSDLENTVWGIGGKFAIPQQSADQVSIAVGASYRRLDGDVSVADGLGLYESLDNKITNWDAYLCATADLTAMGQSEWAGGTRVLGTLGLIYKKAKAEVEFNGDFGTGTADADDSLFRPYLGIEFLGEERTALGLEYRWKDSDLDAKAVFSAVLRHEFEEGFSAELGTTNADQLGFGTDNQNWFVRIGYNFGMK
jgi:hypothetical protein